VEVFYTIGNLTEYAVYLWATHFAGHDDGEEIKRCELHNL
jgi:hypothetical protein